MEDPPGSAYSAPNKLEVPAGPKPPENPTDKPETKPLESHTVPDQPSPGSKVYRTEWPLIATALVSLIGALIAFTFQLIIGESGIAWWHETPNQPPHELHLNPNQTYGRIGLRNLTGKVFSNVGIELQVSRGELVRGIFAADPRDVIPASESRVMNTLETGPKIAPFILKQHAQRFDPGRTWFFYYCGNGLAEVTPAFTEGVARSDFLELKTPGAATTASESKEAQPVGLHLWNWKDTVLEHKIWFGLAALVVCVIATVVFLVKWRKHKEP
jgi:hypothetical protein